MFSIVLFLCYHWRWNRMQRSWFMRIASGRIGVLDAFKASEGYILIHSSSDALLVCFIILINIDYVILSSLLSRIKQTVQKYSSM